MNLPLLSLAGTWMHRELRAFTAELQHWLDRLWTARLWPPGIWLNGRVWLWHQRLIALARLPLRRSGWQSDPWQRQPARHLPGLMFLLSALLVCSLVLRAATGDTPPLPLP